MARRPTPRPTDAELAILRVLWARGPSTVRDVAVEMGREGSYTTVLKLLQIMADKGLDRRDEKSRTHVYEAAHSEDATQRQLVGDLLNRAFDGPDREQHTDDIFVRASVQRALQRTDGRGHCRVQVRQRRRCHAPGERRGIKFMVGVENHCHVECLYHDLIRPVSRQGVKKIRGKAQ